MNALSVLRMFQSMFRKRGRPPEQLPIGGYDDSETKKPIRTDSCPSISGSPRRTETVATAIC